MIKTGITKLNQLSNDKTFCRKELKNVSVTLYDQTLNLVDGDQLAERILLLGWTVLLPKPEPLITG
jgi:hypothetical protein